MFFLQNSNKSIFHLTVVFFSSNAKENNNQEK